MDQHRGGAAPSRSPEGRGGARGAAARPALAVLGGLAEHGAVLLLPGSGGRAAEPSHGTLLPALRMRPFAAAVLRATRRERVLVGRVRYRPRGDPADDARRALRELRALAGPGPLPVVLVGHGEGARAALRVVGDPHVEGVVALAPRWPAGEPVGGLHGRHLVALHDERDRVTRAVDTWSYLARADAAGARVLGIAMPHGGHAMLRTAPEWHRLAAAFTAAMLGLAPFPVPGYGR
ncbi:alpha/beta hydrolase [Streptomyces sp. NPDC046866]|uniref:alpha/beta hydrolase n=1 Tax=Streptomyces sp. NPDC046866 TaxID=3154921 RepID=UPI003455EBBE